MVWLAFAGVFIALALCTRGGYKAADEVFMEAYLLIGSSVAIAAASAYGIFVVR